MNKTLIALAAAFVLLAGFAPARAADPMPLKVAPNAIDIDALYDGAGLSITGEAPVGSDIVVRFVGAEGELHMKEKGRALGLLWMNMGSLTFKNVPTVFLVTGSRDLAAMGPAAAPLRLDSLRDSIQVDGADKIVAVSELLKLKRSEGLYREDVAAVSFGQPVGDKAPFTAALRTPSRLLAGSYMVEVTALKDGQIVAQGAAPVTVKLVSAPAFLADMAFDHAALYGVLATVVALLSGLAIGLVFQSKGAH